MQQATAIALALDPAKIFSALGREADPWQRELLHSKDRQVLLNGCRQAGKSTTVAALALHQVLFVPGSLVLLLSRAQRQAFELFRKIIDGYNALGRPLKPIKETQSELELDNGSRVVGLPGKEENIRSYSGVNLLIIDEASRVPDDLYRSVRPMLAVSQGRLVCLSTPYGQRGFFYNEWVSEGPWKRVKITWKDCPRISEDFIAEETRAMGPNWIKQEYLCQFTALEGLVYPEFEQCIWETWPLTLGKKVGGIDFGWRNPFAAIWGVLDKDDILWIGTERYLRETPLHAHASALPKKHMWYADPTGATEIGELRAAGHTVRKGNNDIRAGIAAVSARIQTQRLHVSRNCRNLIAEAQLYRYPSQSEAPFPGEAPVDENNHALAALRYLVSKLDARFMAKFRRQACGALLPEGERIKHSQDVQEAQDALYQPKPWLHPSNDELWTEI